MPQNYQRLHLLLEKAASIKRAEEEALDDEAWLNSLDANKLTEQDARRLAVMGSDAAKEQFFDAKAYPYESALSLCGGLGGMFLGSMLAPQTSTDIKNTSSRALANKYNHASKCSYGTFGILIGDPLGRYLGTYLGESSGIEQWKQRKEKIDALLETYDRLRKRS